MQSVDRPTFEANNQAEEIDLAELGRMLWHQRHIIIAMPLVTSLFALSVSFLIPKTFVSQATILPQASANSMDAIAAGMASQLGAVAGLLGGAGSSKSEELVEIISSRSMAERVITKCQLDKELTGWKFRSDLVSKAMKMTKITPPTLKSKVIGVAVEAQDPALAAKMANAYVNELQNMLDEIGYNSAAKNRKFVEAQLNKVKADLAMSEQRLTEFQANNHLASLPETVVASIKSMSDLESKQIAAQVEQTATDAALGVIRTKIGTLQADPNGLTELEVKRRSLVAQQTALAKAKESFLSKLTNLPPKAMELARLQRDVQVQNAVYLALSQQYETAIISESKDSDSFLVLDQAAVPDRAAKPKKLFNTLMGLIMGLLLAGVIAVWRERFVAKVVQ